MSERSTDHRPVMGECPDPWHEDDAAPHATYSTVGLPGMVIVGFACLTCGFRTVEVDHYIPVTKPCPVCGKPFDGMPDYDRELCDACFADRLKWLAENENEW